MRAEPVSGRVQCRQGGAGVVDAWSTRSFTTLWAPSGMVIGPDGRGIHTTFACRYACREFLWHRGRNCGDLVYATTELIGLDRMGLLHLQSGEPSRSEAAMADARASSRPLIWFATIAECVAAAASLATKLPLVVYAPLLVAIPLLTFAFVQWRRARAAEETLQQVYHYDRRYLSYVSKWTFSSGADPDFWSGLHHAERTMIALRPIAFFTWNITRRSDADNPFTGAVVVNQNATRSGSGTCTFRDPHKQSSSLTFRVEFDPPVRVNETVELSFDVEVPKHKAATVAKLRERPRAATPPPTDCDYSSVDISYPIDEYIQEVVIPESLGSHRHGLQVLQKSNEFAEEKHYLEKHESVKITHSQLNGEHAWRVSLTRQKPPIGSTYRLLWSPPG